MNLKKINLKNIFFKNYKMSKKKQNTLNNWLGIKEPEKNELVENMESYFYIKWTNKYVPKECYWCNKKPELINYETTINWKSLNKKIHVVGYFEDNDSGFKLKEKKYYNIPYMKSLLQKAIRRGNKNVAVKSAFHFIKMDTLAFLRRLLIIMIEDVIIHESFNTILWLMIVISSDNKYRIKNYMVKYLLGVILVLTTTKKKLLIKDSYDTFDLITFLNNIESNHPNKNIINSLCLRKEYGGLKSDMLLIEKYVQYLYNNDNSKYYNTKIRPIELMIQNLNLDDWIFEAIDFHCDKKIIEYIHNKYGYSEKKIEKIIWHNSSKINYREKQEKLYIQEYNIIKKYLIRLQIFLLQSNF